MNKLFTKIASLALGAAMAFGVGVAVGSNSREASPVHAANSTYNKVSLNDIAAGDQVLIVAYYNSSTWYYLPSTTTSSAPTATSVTISNNTITADLDSKMFTVGGTGTSRTFSNGTNYLANTSANNGVRINTTTSSSWTITATTNGYKMTNNSRWLGVYNGADWRSYTTSNATNYKNSGEYINFYKKAVTKTLSNISVSGYTTSFTVGDAFSFGGTVTASYSDNSSSNVTSSTTFSGYNMSVAGNYTVTASYTEGDVTKTATYSISVSAPSTPFITPAKASTSGYTGQNESLSFTYGNLTGSLSVTSSNTSVVTVGTPSTSAGSGTVQINFVGAGSTTVKFKDGETERASVSVSVSNPTVTITGMPSARSIATGATLDLGSLITVTPTGNLSSDVTWSTSNSSFASVTQSGVVTGEAVGSATITVTPDDYAAGAVSCTVTVANVMTAVFGTTGSSSSTEITDGSKYKTDYSYTIDTNITLSAISKVYPQTSNALKFGSSSVVGSMTFSIPSTIDSKPVYITSVTVRAVRYHETKGTTMLIGGVEKELTYSADDYTADLSSGEVTSFVLTADSSSSDKRMYVQSVSIQYAFKKTLSSIALSGSYQTTFTKGGTFNHEGLVVTATYSDSSTADVTSSATFSGYNLSNVGNQTVTVSYTEGTTKTATYSITVNYAAVTSVTLSQNSAEIGLNETFDYTQVTVTVSPSNANQAVSWSVSANTVGDDYVFNGSGLSSNDTEGTITLKCESVADSSKYATIVVSVTGDPTAAFDKESTSGYAGKSEVIGFTYGNMDDESKIVVASSNTSYVTVANDLLADEGVGLVTINFVAAGSANVTISYDGGSTLDTLTVSVSADSVVSVSWSASNFDVFSGTTLTSDIDNTWLASYEKASGDEGLLEYGDYTLKLGGSAITLPHTWVAADDGKTLCIEYGGVSSSTVSVTVTQTIHSVVATIPGTPISEYQLVESQSDLEEGRYLIVSIEDTKAFDGSLATLDAGRNNFDVTISDGTVIANDSTASGKYFDLTVENDAWTITSASGANVGHSATGNGMNGTGTNTITVSDGISTILGTGGKGLAYNSASGATSERFRYYTSPAANANHSVSLFKLVEQPGTPTSAEIANVATHKEAQRVAVKFAKAFNAAMDLTENCTTGLDAAWATCTSAYGTFQTEAAALGSEKAYAEYYIKYASCEWSDDSGEACIERMLRTYKACVQVHGKTAFMSDLVTLGRVANPVSVITESSSTVAIVIVTAMIGLTAVGGYFFLRKRKEQ